MKKRIRLIIIELSAIFSFLGIIIFLNDVPQKYDVYTGEIYKIENNTIYVKSEDITSYSLIFDVEDVPVYDMDKNKIDVKILKKGDIVYFNENYRYTQIDYDNMPTMTENGISIYYNKKDSMNLKTATVKQIDDERVVLDVCKYYLYSFPINDRIVLKSVFVTNEKKLEVNDIIKIYCKKEHYDWAYSNIMENDVEPLQNVKLIKLLK